MGSFPLLSNGHGLRWHCFHFAYLLVRYVFVASKGRMVISAHLLPLSILISCKTDGWQASRREMENIFHASDTLLLVMLLIRLSGRVRRD